jgi:hypothetical protein
MASDRRGYRAVARNPAMHDGQDTRAARCAPRADGRDRFAPRIVRATTNETARVLVEPMTMPARGTTREAGLVREERVQQSPTPVRGAG